MKTVLIIFISSILFTVQSHAQKGDSIDLVPVWNKHATYKVKVQNTTTDLADGKERKFQTIFNAEVVVKEASEAGFKVEWIFTNAKLDEHDPNVENHVLAKLATIKFLITLTDEGRFVELSNYAEVKPAADRAINERLAHAATDPVLLPQLQTAKSLITTRQGLELLLLKQIKFYYLYYGFNYRLNEVRTNNIKLPNQLGGQPFEALEKITLTKLDRKDSICVIESSKTIDPTIFKATVIEYVKKATGSDPETVAEMNKADMDFSESTIHEFDLKKSFVKKSAIKRVMKFGFQNRVSLLEMESVD